MPTSLWHSPTVRFYCFLYWCIQASNALVIPIYVAFLLSKGLTIFQTTMVNLVYLVVMGIFEVPTGALADVIGRKRSVAIATFGFSLGFAVYAVSHTLIQFIIAEVILALATVMLSGAFQAWLYQHLHLEGYAPEQGKVVLQRAQVIGRALSIGGGPLGGLLIAVDVTLPFVVGAVIFGIACSVTILVMHDVPYRRHSFRRACVIFRSGIRYTYRHPAIRAMFLFGFIQAVAVQSPNMLWQPYFQPHLGGVQYLGWFSSALSIALLIGSMVVRVDPSTQFRLSRLVLLQACIGVTLAITPLGHYFPFIVLAFLLHEIFRGMYAAVEGGFLNECITVENKRATVLSATSVGEHIGGVIGLPLTGAIASHYSISAAWALSGLFLAGATLLVWRNVR